MQHLLLCVVAASAADLAAALANVRQFYSSNFMCVESRCVNPIFPAFRLLGNNVLESQEGRSWTCIDGIASLGSSHSNAMNYKSYTKFCEDVLDYSFAVPDWQEGISQIEDVISKENDRAIEAFISQVDGFGIEARENTRPQLLNATNPCIYNIWKLACYTHFPRCGVSSQGTQYLRPCRGGCDAYVKACGIQCCDEGVECVFEHKERVEKAFGEAEFITLRGYVDHPGPSSFCTGSNSVRTGIGCVFLLWFLVFLADNVEMGAALQTHRSKATTATEKTQKKTAAGSSARMHTKTDVSGQHLQAYWRRKPDFTKERQSARDPITNGMGFSSCNNNNIPDAYKCSMHGVCVAWDSNSGASPSQFLVCQCDQDWAGMECKIERKKRFTAYVLSLLFGWLGADRFYMGSHLAGVMKMLSLGGFGVWWAHDIVWIGGGDVYAANYRLAPSNGTAFIPPVATPMVFLMLGFFISVLQAAAHIRQKRVLEADILRNYDISELTTHKNELGGFPLSVVEPPSFDSFMGKNDAK